MGQVGLLYYDVHFRIDTLGKGMNLLYPPPSYGLNSTTVVLLLYKDGFGIK